MEESEARYRFALRAGHMGSWELDIATMAFYTSDHCKKNFGQPIEKPFSYQALLDSIHPDDLQRQEKEVLETITTGKEYDIEYRVIWPDGTLHWVNIRGKLHNDSDGKPSYLIGVSLDITDRKLTEIGLSKALDETKKQKRLYDSITSNTPDLVYVFSTSYQFTYANEALLTMWGKTAEEAIGKGLRENGYEEWHAQMHEREIDEIIEKKKIIRGTVSFPHAELGSRVYDYILVPVLNDAGIVEAIAGTTRDITDIKQAEEKLLQGEMRLKTMIDQTPAPTLVLMGDDLVVEQINEPMLRMLGRGEEVIGIPLIETLPELKGQYVWEQVLKVYSEGINFDQSEVLVPHNRTGVIEDHYYNVAYRPLKENGKIIGMIQVAIDVTEQVLARKKIEESEAYLQLTRNAIPAMVFYIDAEQRYRSYNGVFMEWFNVNAIEALGKTVKAFVGDIAYAKITPYLEKAYAGQRVEYILNAPQRIGEDKWLNIAYTPHKNSDDKVIGLIVHATDITEHTLTLKKIEESEARFRNLLQEAPVAATLFRGPELIIEVANELTLKYWRKKKDIIGKRLADAAPELEEQQLIALVKSVYERGGIESFSETPIRFIEDGVVKNGYYSFSLKALYNSKGEVESVLSTGIDVTEQVQVRKQIEQKERELRELIAAAPIGICVVSGSPLKVDEVNERFLQISGKTREQYASAPYWEVLQEVAPIFQPILEGVFTSGQKYTTEENEMVLIRDGVPESIFLTFEYIPVFEKDKVIKVIVMAVEVTYQLETRKEIEKAVVERTKELAESNLQLKRSNEELEQFAYIASHDLQEPIRKISTFSQLLDHSIKDKSEKTADYLKKIFNSTERMTNLVRDVLAFSQVNDNDNAFERIDLNAIINSIKTDFELQIEETKTTIETNELPVLEAIPGQMSQLFSNLLSNSIKYRKSGVNPVIEIRASVAKEEKVKKRFALDPEKKYYHIEFKDNGIGFDGNQVERIFKIFQRLHGKAEYEGTGIGLAICRKIVQRHQGHISAEVGENGGAIFNILLPEKNN